MMSNMRHLTPAHEAKTLAGCSPCFREITPADRDQILGLFLSLSPHARYSRFLMPATDDYITRYVAGFDFNQMVGVGLFSQDRLLALGELYLGKGEPGEDPLEGEIALTVRDNFFRNGVGSMLARFLKIKAQSLGLRRVHVSCMPTNTPMRRIARSVGMFEKSFVSEVTASASL